MRHILNRQFSDLLTNDESIGLIRDFYHSGFVKWSDTLIPFKSGRQSHVYVGGREDVTTHPAVLRKLGTLVARAAFRMVPPSDDRDLCLIGIPMAGSALAVAASLESGAPFLAMRQVKKTTHGAHGSWVDGTPNPENYRYVTVDNTITDGGSKFETIEKLTEDGFPAPELLHLIVVDREIGGLQRLTEQHIHASALFSLTSIIRAYRELGLWTTGKVEAIEQEIARDSIR